MNFTISILIAALVGVLILTATNRSPMGKLRSATEARQTQLTAAAQLLNK